MFLHLASTGHWALFWPDLPHKFQRKQAMAVEACKTAKARMKQLMKVFRSSRAPFATSRFGKMLGEARGRLTRALKQDPDNPLLQMYLHGIAKDLDIPLADMTPEKAIQALASRKGRLHVKSCECKDARWGAWIDHAQRWDEEWHLETMIQLYSEWESGRCPWTGQPLVDPECKDDRVYSILKLRWHVP